MTKALTLSAVALSLFSAVTHAENASNQFVFSSSEHGNVCNESPDVWTLGGELTVDAPITLNGKTITREVKGTRSNTLAALLGKAGDETTHYQMSSSIACLKSDSPIDMVGAVAAFYEQRYTSLSSVDLPAPIPEPELPAAPEIVKDQFETKAQFQERVAKLSTERQQQIAQIQQDYRQAVEARNAVIRKLQQDIETKKQGIEQKRTDLVAHAFRDVMGKPVVSANSYDAENQKMYLTFKASNQDYQRDVAINVPLAQAREIFDNIEQFDLALTYQIADDQLELVNIGGQYKDQHFGGDLASSNYQPEQLSVVLNNSSASSLANIEMQNPNLVDKFEVESKLTLATHTQDDLKTLLDSITPKAEDKSLWFFNLAIEDYANSDEVAFSKNSGEMMAQVAHKGLGVPERHIYSLIDSGATSGAIKDKLRLMLDNIQEGDTVYFYYSGHGIPALPDHEPYILPQDKIPDYVTDEPFFKLNNLYGKLSASKAGKIVVMVDSCFSGATDGVSVIKGVAASRLAPKKVAIDPERMVVITAGRDKEYSNMYVEKGHRLFSYYLMKSVLEGKQNINDLYQDVYDKVKSASFEMGDLKRQHPTISGNQTLTL